MGGGTAVGLAHEPVQLEAADVATDRHLGDAEVSGELRHVDGLFVGDPLEDLVASVDGVDRPTRAGAARSTRRS